MTAETVATELVDIDHLGLNVSNLAASERWYQDMLGFHILHRWKTTTLVGLGNVKLGLFWRPDAKPIDNLDSWICMQHLAFLVDGNRFIQTRQKLIEKGIDVVNEDNGIAYCVFFEDPDGHLLELITYHAVPRADLSPWFDPQTHPPEYISKELHDHVPRRRERSVPPSPP
jgi:catechol 2,3-dioxygenase-like lactoylglutathione lyase family enzyme